MRTWLLSVFLALRLFSNAQKEDWNWVMGDYPLIFRFNENGFTVDSNFYREYRTFFITSSSISDSLGNLLFYTNGKDVFNKLGVIMDNGDSLNPSEYVNPILGNGCIQGTLILKKPGSSYLYYLFHFTADDVCPPPVLIPKMQPCTLYYSIIDMQLNEGRGKVIEKNHIFLKDVNLSTTQFNAVRHANGEDWWLLKHAYLSDTIYTFLFTKDGLAGPFIQKAGIYSAEDEALGQTIFSKDGTTMYTCSGFNPVSIFRFDRCSGELDFIDTFSVFNPYFKPLQPSTCIGLAFSPNEKYLYANSVSRIFQYDLESADYKNSKVEVYVNPVNGKIDQDICTIQLAPDGKIYCNPYGCWDSLSVIMEPDKPGLQCDFRLGAIPVRPSPFNFCLRQIPLFPDYHLGASPIYKVKPKQQVSEICSNEKLLLEVNEVEGVSYRWYSNSGVQINGANSSEATVGFLTENDSVTIYLESIDTVSTFTCTERLDSFVLYVRSCYYPRTQYISGYINKTQQPLLQVQGLVGNIGLSLWDELGRLIYEQSNYQNDYNTKSLSEGVYYYRLKNGDIGEVRGKFLVK